MGYRNWAAILTGAGGLPTNGKTIDQLDPAIAGSDGDQLPLVQGGGSTAKRMVLSALWAYVAGQLPSYRKAKVEVSGTVTLDGPAHVGKVLLATGPTTLQLPGNFANLTNNSSSSVSELTVMAVGGAVSFGTGITVAGASTLLAGQSAVMRFATTLGGQNIASAATLSAGAAAPIVINGPGSTPYVAAGATTTGAPIAGTLTGYGSAPTLSYTLDGAAYAALPSGATVATTTFSFALAGLAAGAHSLAMRDSAGGTSNTLNFVVEGASLAGIPTSGYKVGTATTLTGATLTLAGLTGAYAVLYDGATDVGSRVAVSTSANLAAMSVTPATANASSGIRLYDAATGGNVLAFSTIGTVASNQANGGFTLSGGTLSGTATGNDGKSYTVTITTITGTMNNATGYTFGTVAIHNASTNAPIFASNGAVRVRTFTDAAGTNDMGPAGNYGSGSPGNDGSNVSFYQDLRSVAVGGAFYLGFKTDDGFQITLPYAFTRGA